jgi:hypothetical protein
LGRGLSAADTLFGDLQEKQDGTICAACASPRLLAHIDNVILGMLGEGPLAHPKLTPNTNLTAIWKMVSDPVRAAGAGVPVYPRKERAFRIHVQQHRAELWQRVEAKQATS